MGSALQSPWHRASYELAIVLGRSAASEDWVFLLSPGSHGPLEQTPEMVALHCATDLLSAWTDWTEPKSAFREVAGYKNPE